jgi:hypothetical protein
LKTTFIGGGGGEGEGGGGGEGRRIFIFNDTNS